MQFLISDQTGKTWKGFTVFSVNPSFTRWWSWTGSNRWPLECHSSALPTELQPHSRSLFITKHVSCVNHFPAQARYFLLDRLTGFGYNSGTFAGVVKLVDALDSKSSAREGIPVRPRSPAPVGKKGFQVTTFVKPEGPFSFNNAAKICGGEQSHAEKSGGESGKWLPAVVNGHRPRQQNLTARLSKAARTLTVQMNSKNGNSSDFHVQISENLTWPHIPSQLQKVNSFFSVSKDQRSMIEFSRIKKG